MPRSYLIIAGLDYDSPVFPSTGFTIVSVLYIVELELIIFKVVNILDSRYNWVSQLNA